MGYNACLFSLCSYNSIDLLSQFIWFRLESSKIPASPGRDRKALFQTSVVLCFAAGDEEVDAGGTLDLPVSAPPVVRRHGFPNAVGEAGIM